MTLSAVLIYSIHLYFSTFMYLWSYCKKTFDYVHTIEIASCACKSRGIIMHICVSPSRSKRYNNLYCLSHPIYLFYLVSLILFLLTMSQNNETVIFVKPWLYKQIPWINCTNWQWPSTTSAGPGTVAILRKTSICLCLF